MAGADVGVVGGRDRGLTSTISRSRLRVGASKMTGTGRHTGTSTIGRSRLTVQRLEHGRTEGCQDGQRDNKTA